MRRHYPRTTIATLLTLTAIVLPCTAWYLAGVHSTREQAERIRGEPLQRASAQAARMAELVADRLKALRQSESRRPFHEYAPAGQLDFPGCEVPQLTASPLAQGPTDPLIWTHFQIDPVGELTIPSMSAMPAAEAEAVFEELECAASQRIAALRRTTGYSERELVQTPDGVVQVGPFQWHTVSIHGEPARVALREVTTRDAVLTQGFVVLKEALDSLLVSGSFPAATEPTEPLEAGEALIPTGGDPWIVRVEAARETRTAAAAATARWQRFYGLFAAGTFGALLAGSLLVGLVWQSERLARSRVHFAASAAHELRTPLAGIQLHAELLAHAQGKPEKAGAYAQRIADEAERLGRVVTNVLGYSRLQRDGLHVQPRSGDLGHAVRSFVERVQPTLEAKGVRLEVAIDEELPAAEFDGDAVDQILLNLVDNAEKYSRSCDDRTIAIQLRGKTDGLTLAVIDRGEGVDPGVRKRLFEPFARGGDPDAPAGLGIGLALVKALAEAHGAEVRHDELEGRRTRFLVAFPTTGAIAEAG